LSATANWPTAGAPTTGTVPTDNLIALVNYYVARLIIQYADKPKAQGIIALFVKQFIADDLATILRDAFNLDTAVGPQLDTIAKYVGLNRNIGLPTFPPFFSMRDYTGANPQGTHGFALYDGSSPATGAFYDYTQQINPTALPDAAFAFLLRLKIAINHLDGTYAGIQQFIAQHLSAWVTVTDNQDMTLTYTIAANPPVAPTILAGFLPKPMGVGKIITYL
jgi:hypothetical protein